MKRKQVHRRGRVRKLQSNKMHYYFFVLSVAFLFFATGCGGGSPPSSLPKKENSPVAEKKKPEPLKVAKEKELVKKEEPDYTYNPVGKPDPFKPFIQIAAAKEYSRTIPLTPLQKYEISQLKLVAIITTSEGNVALVEDSAGKGYFLKRGTEIGKNDGKVKRILKDKVIIEEVYEDIQGQKKINEVSLFLRQAEEGGES